MKLTNITKVYHNKHNDVIALKDVTLTIDQNGITAILGESGCGKTTLLHIISGRDRDFSGYRECNATIEMIEQEIILFEALSVYDNLRIIIDDPQRIDTLLRHFQMEDHKDQKIKRLSVGQKKRVQIIRSLLKEPDYLLCDEPTTALDYDNAILVMEMLKEVSQKISVIIVTHDITLANQYADVIVRMENGGIEQVDRKHQRHAVVINNKQMIKKGFIQHLKLFSKLTLSRIKEVSLLFIIIFILCFSVFSSFIFREIDQSVDEKGKWSTSENFIAPQPNEGNDIYRPISDDDKPDDVLEGTYYYYDLYYQEDIALIKDNLTPLVIVQDGTQICVMNQEVCFLHLPIAQWLRNWKKQNQKEES